MKRLVSVLLVLVMILSVFASCQKTEDKTPVTYNLDAAKAYVKSLYIEKTKTKLQADLEVVTKVKVDNVEYTVSWATDSEQAKVVAVSDTAAKIDIDEKAEAEYSFKLTATVTAGDGTTAKVEFKFTVAQYLVFSFEEYMAAKEGDAVVVEGIVVAINSKSTGSKRNHLFLADASGKGGYYSYQMDQDPIADLHIQVGMTVSVAGPIKPYNGMQEISGGTATVISTAITPYAPVDITEIVTKSDYQASDLLNYVALPVTIKGVTVGTQVLNVETSQYLNFSIGGFESYIRTYLTDLPNPLNADSKAAIDAAHAEKFGWTANVTGILVYFNASTPYLIPISVDCFEYTGFVEKTPEEKIATELEALELPAKLGADKVIDVITAGQFYSDVTLTWASGDAAIVYENGKLTVTIPAAATTVTVTVTATVGGKSDTKTFEIALVPNTFTLSENTPYFFGFDAAGTLKYLNGENAGGKNFRWDLTDKAEEAMAYYVEATEGGYYIYYYGAEGAKTYLNIVKNGDYTNLLAGTEGLSVWKYDPSLEAMVVEVDGKTYTPKNYSNYTNVEAKTLDYLESESNTYVLCLMAVPFNFAFQDSNGAMNYLDGENAGGKDFRWNLTKDASLAALFYVEGNADGTYYIYFYKNGEKTYFNIVKNGTYTNLLAGTEPLSKWSYNETVGGFVVDVDGTLYTPKNYGGYSNVEAKSTDYTNGDTYVLDLWFVGDTGNSGGSGNEGGGNTEPTPNPNPGTGTEPTGDQFLFGFTADGASQYLDGTTVTDKAFRWNLTSDASKAAVFFVEDAGNGACYIYFMKDGVKTYLNIVENGTYVNLLAGDTAISKWTYNNDLAAFVVEVNGALYLPKSYGGYNTIEAKTSDYTNGNTYNLSLMPATSNPGQGGGNTEPTPNPNPGTTSNVADFETMQPDDGSSKNTYYADRTSTNGWKVHAAQVLAGSDNADYAFMGTATSVCLNGKTSQQGSITSPTLAGGIKQLNFSYGFCYTDTQFSIKIEIKQNGAVVASKDVSMTGLTKLTAYSFTWDLDTPITGEFVIVITNTSLSNSGSNKDRLSIWNLTWN